MRYKTCKTVRSGMLELRRRIGTVDPNTGGKFNFLCCTIDDMEREEVITMALKFKMHDTIKKYRDSFPRITSHPSFYKNISRHAGRRFGDPWWYPDNSKEDRTDAIVYRQKKRFCSLVIEQL